MGFLSIATVLAWLYERKPRILNKKYVIENKPKKGDDEAIIEAEIERQLQENMAKRQQETNQIKISENEMVSSPAPVENSQSLTENLDKESSEKKVVKKRVVKMLKAGEIVAEKEEVLDKEGNVVQVNIRDVIE